VVIKSFREYLDKLRSAGELVEINEEVSVDLEVAALLRQLMYSGGPAVIIRRTRERTLPIVGNLFSKWDRVCDGYGG
jgi:3-polyprenyl-4-hydroxybenzoate decarboxylase and related decarboxylases